MCFFEGIIPEDIPVEKPKVEELDEILVPKHILLHKRKGIEGKFNRHYSVKFENNSPLDKKWMEKPKLVDLSQLLQW